MFGGCDGYLLADLYFDLGYAYFKERQVGPGIRLFNERVSLVKIRKQKVIAFSLYHFGLYQFDRGLCNFDRALKLAEDMNLRRLKRDIYLANIRLYEKMNNLTKVVEFQNKYIATKDEIFNEQMASNLKEIQLDAQRKQSEVIINRRIP